MLFIRYTKSLLIENQTKKRPIQQLDEIDQLASTLDANMAKELHIPKDVLDSFKLKDTLNPEIWNDFELNPKVRKKLIKIAHDFIKNLDLPKPIVIKDIIFTGSLANYNWSKFSDIDLHVIIDFKQLESDPTLTKDYFNAKKSQWNQEHDITIFDYPVELYVQDVADKLVATAVYSVQNDKWLKKPIRQNFKLDKQIIKTKAEQFISQLKDIRDAYKKEKYNIVVKKVKSIKDKIKQMRKAGLESGGEFSNENLVFKVLRRTTFMDVLDSFKAKAYDQLMSVVEKIELNEAILDERLVDDAKFKSKKTEDGYELLAFYNNEEIASLVLNETINGYWIFDGDLTQDEYDEIFPDDKFMQITHLSIPDPKYRGGGIARKLMTLAIQKSKTLGYDTIYLDASPVEADEGLNLNDLVSFYESFGFNVFKHQGNNALMVLYLNKQLKEEMRLPDTTHKQELKYLQSKSLSANKADINKVRYRMASAASVAANYQNKTGDNQYFMLPDDGNGFYQVEFRHDGNIRTKQIRPSADMEQLGGKFHPSDVGTCKDFQNIARYCFVKAGKPISDTKFSVGVSPAEDAANKALIIFKNEILNFYSGEIVDPEQAAQISKEKMTQQQAKHKLKKDLEAELGHRITDAQWNHYLETGEKPKGKSTITMDPKDLEDFEARQKAAAERRAAALARMGKK